MRNIFRTALITFVFLFTVAAFAQNAKPGKKRDDCAKPAKSAALATGCKVLDEFMTGFNSRDSLKWAQTLNYPHVRLAGDGVLVWNTPEDYAKTNNLEDFAKKTGWHHSKWAWRQLVQSSDDRLHFLVEFIRYDDAGVQTATFESLYILTKVKGHWGVQARSSFAGVTTPGAAY